ncbi:hypothetical protein BPOR_0117g00150 [Botrytis porri]|uniref:Uncharacterized protein n=1 Tax=Botrytis porri TaxID=87229 RepID=A0A4Z1KXF7_9HELO|nr:hypothetical protein BPOR_0117g00150 [Botrytis porri]
MNKVLTSYKHEGTTSAISPMTQIKLIQAREEWLTTYSERHLSHESDISASTPSTSVWLVLKLLEYMVGFHKYYKS